MTFSTAHTRDVRAEINITPMIDVLLVLIIVFMVIVSTSTRKGLQAQIPQSGEAHHNSESALIIQVRCVSASGAPVLRINDESVSWDNLHERLLNVFMRRTEHVVFVNADPDVDFQYAADAISIARGSGAEKVGLLGRIATQ
jgi:biopolymer transport protein ExbD